MINKKYALPIIAASLLGLIPVAYMVNSNTQVDIALPDGTILHNVVLSQDNFTRLQQNVAFMAVVNQTNTSQQAQNYCPIAKEILTHQDGYLSGLIKNNETQYVYPSWCYSESGPISVPEFPVGEIVLLFMFVGVILLGRLTDGHWVWQFGKQ